VNTAADASGDDDDLDAYVRELAARAPPLSAEQRDKLALLLSPRRAA
jgi:hypothetical protein